MNFKSYPKIILLSSTLFMTACATIPNGPSKMALPGTGKSFDQFRADDSMCRQFAFDQIGGKTANQASDESFAKNAILGTAIGAAIGAAAGGGHGAGVGAATGVAVGSMVGLDESRNSSYNFQQRYDNAYVQCMYAKGHQVPVYGQPVMQRNSNMPLAPIDMPAASVPPPPPNKKVQ